MTEQALDYYPGQTTPGAAACFLEHGYRHVVLSVNRCTSDAIDVLLGAGIEVHFV